jgi:hypothetical protein
MTAVTFYHRDGSKEVVEMCGWTVHVEAPALRHKGYAGWPTHPPPHGWRQEMADEINDLLDWARADRNNRFPPDPLY